MQSIYNQSKFECYVLSETEDTPVQFEDGFGYVERYPSGRLLTTRAYHGLRVDRDDGLASVHVYYDNVENSLIYRAWYFTDHLQRSFSEGPAYESFHPNGQKRLEYWTDNYEERRGEPYMLAWHPNGRLHYKVYWIENGTRIVWYSTPTNIEPGAEEFFNLDYD